jgi:hypothetical protein
MRSGVVLLVVCLAACRTTSPAASAPEGDASTENDAGTDAAPSADAGTGVDTGPPTANLGTGVLGDAAGRPVLAVKVSPLTLTPAFSASVSDYYVRCAAGANPLTVSVTDTSGTTEYALTAVENQAIVVDDQYWIRCLPSDFPTIAVTQYPDVGAPTAGYYLVNSTTYAMALDTNGTPVWYTHGSSMANVDSPAPDEISFMPAATAPFGTSATAAFVVDALDTNTSTTIVSPDGDTDPHELQLLPNGDHLLFTYPIESGVDLSGLDSFTSNETMADCEIDEVSPSGSLVWSWLVSDHVDPVMESLEPQTESDNGQTVIDVFHCNSIDVDSTGNLLLSLRHANAVFYIDRSTGLVEWKLGGAAYNKDGATHIVVQNDPETTFSMQHDARFQAGGDISLFDDHGAGTGPARGIEYSLDHTTNVATVVWQFPGTTASLAEGSFRKYPDGERVIGWGAVSNGTRIFTETNSNAEDVLDIEFSGDIATYRAVKVPTSELNINVLRRTAGH